MSQEFNTYYFAYGSNLNIERLKNRKVSFHSALPGVLNDYKLVFNKIASKNHKLERYANIIEAKNSIVEGVLYQITIDSLKELDKHEGFPNHYNRYEKEILIKSTGEIVKAWVYIANQDKTASGKPSRDYLENILAGKDNLSPEYFQKLTLIETLD